MPGMVRASTLRAPSGDDGRGCPNLGESLCVARRTPELSFEVLPFRREHLRNPAWRSSGVTETEEIRRRRRRSARLLSLLSIRSAADIVHGVKVRQAGGHVRKRVDPVAEIVGSLSAVREEPLKLAGGAFVIAVREFEQNDFRKARVSKRPSKSSSRNSPVVPGAMGGFGSPVRFQKPPAEP